MRRRQDQQIAPGLQVEADYFDQGTYSDSGDTSMIPNETDVVHQGDGNGTCALGTVDDGTPTPLIAETRDGSYNANRESCEF